MSIPSTGELRNEFDGRTPKHKLVNNREEKKKRDLTTTSSDHSNWILAGRISRVEITLLIQQSNLIIELFKFLLDRGSISNTDTLLECIPIDCLLLLQQFNHLLGTFQKIQRIGFIQFCHSSGKRKSFEKKILHTHTHTRDQNNAPSANNVFGICNFFFAAEKPQVDSTLNCGFYY